MHRPSPRGRAFAGGGTPAQHTPRPPQCSAISPSTAHAIDRANGFQCCGAQRRIGTRAARRRSLRAGRRAGRTCFAEEERRRRRYGSRRRRRRRRLRPPLAPPPAPPGPPPAPASSSHFGRHRPGGGLGSGTGSSLLGVARKPWRHSREPTRHPNKQLAQRGTTRPRRGRGRGIGADERAAPPASRAAASASSRCSPSRKSARSAAACDSIASMPLWRWCARVASRRSAWRDGAAAAAAARLAASRFGGTFHAQAHQRAPRLGLLARPVDVEHLAERWQTSTVGRRPPRRSTSSAVRRGPWCRCRALVPVAHR